MITFSQFEDKYTQDVIDIVLHFQNHGTRPIVSADDQPDLLHILRLKMSIRKPEIHLEREIMLIV